jgi:hypothetical protein
MPNDIRVDNSIEPGSVDVKTEELEGKHYPWMKVTWGAQGAIPVPVDEENPLPVAVDADEDNPLPVEGVVDGAVISEDNPVPVNQVLNSKTDTVIWLCEISRQLKVLIEYQALLHKVNLDEES